MRECGLLVLGVGRIFTVFFVIFAKNCFLDLSWECWDALVG